mgnify:CR=1 FL=1
MRVAFTAEVFEWRGPAPYHFVRVPDDHAESIAEVASAVTYGWGMIPVTVRVGETAMTTALWPKAGSYYVPLKDALRRSEGVTLGEQIDVELEIDV